MSHYHERLHKTVLELSPLKQRELIVWCAKRSVPETVETPALAAVNAADAYVKGDLSYAEMRKFHAAAIRFYSSTHIEDRPWKNILSAHDAMNAAMLAKLCTVDDNHIGIAAQDAIYVAHALEPFDEMWLMIGAEVESLGYA